MAKRYAWRPISEVYPNYVRQGNTLTAEPKPIVPVVPMAAPVTVSDVLADLAAAEPAVPDVSHDEASELMKELEAMAAYHNV